LFCGIWDPHDLGIGHARIVCQTYSWLRNPTYPSSELWVTT